MAGIYSEFIKKLRQDTNLSLSAFGDLFDSTGQTVSNWENSKTDPSQYQMILLSQLRNKLDKEKNKAVNDGKIDYLGKLILTIGGGVGLIYFLRWLTADD